MLQNCITSFLITQCFCNVLTPKPYIVSSFNDRNFVFFIMEHFLYNAHTIPNIYTHFFKPLYDSLRGFHFVTPFFKGSKRGVHFRPPFVRHSKLKLRPKYRLGSLKLKGGESSPPFQLVSLTKSYNSFQYKSGFSIVRYFQHISLEIGFLSRYF